MTKDQLSNFIWAQFVECHLMMERKNADYGADSDPFKNFRKYEELGILVRLSDKISRLETLLHKDPSVTGEKELDTIQDAINYLALYAAYRSENKGSSGNLSGNAHAGSPTGVLPGRRMEAGEVRGLVYGEPCDPLAASLARTQERVLSDPGGAQVQMGGHASSDPVPGRYPG